MKLLELPNEFKKAQPVLEIIHQAGFEAYFVGGSVRDVLLDQSIHDVDIATSAFPEEIKDLFPRTIDVGIDHGTVLVLVKEDSYEITTFRTESTYQDYRRPDRVEFVRSLEEDLKRRDFTMNALALAHDGEVIDLFSGLEDIHQRIIRAVGEANERFHEDALRMMRGLRFVSQLDFVLEDETCKAIEENSYLLEKISVERIEIEFMKLLTGVARNKALKLFIQTNCYQYCPELRKYSHELLAMTTLPSRQLDDEVQAWTLLVDQLKITPKEIPTFLKQWKASNDCIRKVQKTYAGLQVRKVGAWTAWDVYQLGQEAVLSVEGLLNYFSIESDETTASHLMKSLPIQSLKELKINGNNLLELTNQTPGKWVKETLMYLEKKVVMNQLVNDSHELKKETMLFLASNRL